MASAAWFPKWTIGFWLLLLHPQDPQKITFHEAVPVLAQKPLRKALPWLARAQNRDGSWGDNPGSMGDVSNTSIATLALMSTGDTPSQGKYAWRIRRGLEYVWKKTRRYGAGNLTIDQQTLIQRKLGKNIDLYLSALLYSQVLGVEPSVKEQKAYQIVLGRMVKQIASFQAPSGKFEESYEPMLTTVAAWMSLRQAHDAGIAIQQASPKKVLRYLKEDCFDPRTGFFTDRKWGNRMRFVSQAGGLRVLYGMGQAKTVEARKATAVVMNMRFDQDVGSRAGGEEFLGALYATQALRIEDDANFRRFYRKMVKALAKCQNSDGSWFGHHCISGRVFCTACSIMTMLTPNKLLPMLER